MNILLPDKVIYILEKLYENNFDAYVVGGCVRDSLLGKQPKDWDITTDALPEDIREIFGSQNTIPTGIKYGTVTVLVDRESFEVTTYRVDMGYSDARRPDEVVFTSSLEEELGRRDFTINAMAYNQKSGLVDIFGGRGDLQKRIIRCVGDPNVRFSEDALRMMRAIRFAAQLGFEIDDSTFKAIYKNRSLIEKISAERINAELTKILESDNPSKVGLMFLSWLAKYILPEAMETYRQVGGYRALHDGLKVMEKLEPSAYLRMAVLLYQMVPGCSGENICQMLRRLRYDNNTIKKVKTIIQFLDIDIDDKSTLKRYLNIMGLELFKDLLKVKTAYVWSGILKDCVLHNMKVKKIKKLLEEILSGNECFTVRDLAVNGEDLIKLGFFGKQIGQMLQQLLDLVIDNPEINKKEELLNIAVNLLKTEQ